MILAEELRAAIATMRNLEAKATKGPWDAEHKPHNDPSQCGVTLEDSDGNTLLDSFNRGYKVSLIDRLDDEGGKWSDVAGMKDAALSAALRNIAPAMLDLAEAARKRMISGPNLHYSTCGLYNTVSGCDCGQAELEQAARAFIAAAKEIHS